MRIRIKKLDENAKVPTYATAGSAGADLYSIEDIIVDGITLVRTGIAIEIPPGFEGQVRPKSGRCGKEGLCVPNSPGTIDSDYRGEIKILLFNIGDPVVITKGEKIAQLVITTVYQSYFFVAEELGNTFRGDGGFGSTGVK